MSVSVSEAGQGCFPPAGVVMVMVGKESVYLAIALVELGNNLKITVRRRWSHTSLSQSLSCVTISHICLIFAFCCIDHPSSFEHLYS